MLKVVAGVLVVAGSLCVNIAAANEKACMLEGSVSLMGVSLEINDCLQNKGLAPAKFTETCTAMSKMYVPMGGQPAKITYVASCPTPAQGICENMARQPLDSYHYSTDAGTLTGASASCSQSGGSWQ